MALVQNISYWESSSARKHNASDIITHASTVDDAVQVMDTMILPHDEAPMLLPQAAETFMKKHFTSLTAAKKAIRRKELLVEGKICNTSRQAAPHVGVRSTSCALHNFVIADGLASTCNAVPQTAAL